MKILIYDLPEKEEAYIKRNCKKEIESEVIRLYHWQELSLSNAGDQKRKSEEHKIFVGEKELPDIVISQNPAMLQVVVSAGVTSIAYQNRVVDTMEPDTQNRENSVCNIANQKEESSVLIIEREPLPQVDIIVEGFEEVDFNFFERIWQRHHHIPWTILETERLVVRELALDDMDALFELYSYEGMTDYMEGLYPYEEEYAYQKAYIENMYGFFGYGMWLVFEKESGQLVGRAGVEHREALEGELELGYAIGTPWQGKGYATEVCQGILKYVQEELYFEEITSLVEPDNKASVHLLEKLDFFLEMELDLEGTHYKKYKKCFKPL